MEFVSYSMVSLAVLTIITIKNNLICTLRTRTLSL